MCKIDTWRQFSRKVRLCGRSFLTQLAGLDNVVFVTGCQRSGTTLLTNILLSLDGFDNYLVNSSRDGELEGALMLAGDQDYHYRKDKRYCFQTTYVNEQYAEYYSYLDRFRMIFVLRNPYSVVYSMLNNWGGRLGGRNFALNELFKGCGVEYLSKGDANKYNLIGTIGLSRLRSACYAYTGKVSQVFELKKRLGEDLLVIDYDQLVNNKSVILPKVFEFIGEPYMTSYGDVIHGASVSKADRFSEKKRRIISQICLKTYKSASRLVC